MRGDGRGQASVLAIALLLGIVVTSSTVVIVVGMGALSSIEDEAQTERSVSELESVSHEISSVIATSDSSALADVEGEYRVTDGATVDITVVDENGTEHDVPPYDTRRLEADDVVYEGGMLLEGTRVIDSPDVDFSDRHTRLQIPVLEDTTGNSVGGTLEHSGTDRPVTAVTNEPERVEITIESEYYEQWYDELEGANADVTKSDDDEAVHVVYALDESGPGEIDQALRLGMSSDSTFDLNEIPNTHVESYQGEDFDRDRATITTTSDAGNKGAGKDQLKVQGDLLSEGDVSDFEGSHRNHEITGEVKSNQDLSTPTPTDELLLDADSSFREYEPDEDLTGGMYNHSGDLTIDADTSVTDPSVLVVEGDLTVSDATLEVDEALDVHVHGSLILEDGATVATTDGPYESDRVSAFVTDDIEVRGGGSPSGSFTGVLYGTDSTLEVDRDSVEIYGAAVLDDVTGHQNHGEFTLYYDERLEDVESPYAVSGDTVETVDEVVDEESFEEDIEIDGPTELNSDYTGNVRVNGDLEGMDENEVDGDLLVDGDVSGELDEATVTGDLLVTGDVDGELDGMSIDGDLRIGGGPTKKLDGTTIGGDLVVGGDVGNELGNVAVGGDLRIDGSLEGEFDGTDIGGDLLVLGDVTDEPDGGTVGDNVVIGGDLTDKLAGTDIDNDLFVDGRITGEIDEAVVGGHMTVRDGIDAEADGGEIGNDLMVDGDTGKLDGTVIGNDLLLTGETGERDGVDVGGEIDTDADPETFPTLEDYINDHTETITIPDLAGETSDGEHYFDVRIAEVRLE